MNMNIDKKFNQEMRDVAIKLKAVAEEIKRITIDASNCSLLMKTREEFNGAFQPLLEAEAIMYQKGLMLELIEEEEEAKEA